jgi:hypothetical protein
MITLRDTYVEAPRRRKPSGLIRGLLLGVPAAALLLWAALVATGVE